MLRLSRCNGTPNIGVYATANEDLALVAANAGPGFAAEVEAALGVEAVQTTVSGSFVVGSLARMNSNGAVVSGMIEASELDAIKSRIGVTVLPDKANAAGNNILANDNGAVINPALGAPAARRVADALGVEVVRSAIAGCGVVGSVCAATNKGCVCCAGATEEDMALLRDVLGVEARKASVNHGSPQVGAGMLCNSKGALVGDETTPVEMGRIEDGLALY